MACQQSESLRSTGYQRMNIVKNIAQEVIASAELGVAVIKIFTRNLELQMQIEALEIRALLPHLLNDFLGYFEGTAFADNPK
jgi:hypothetical protein